MQIYCNIDPNLIMVLIKNLEISCITLVHVSCTIIALLWSHNSYIQVCGTDINDTGMEYKCLILLSLFVQ